MSTKVGFYLPFQNNEIYLCPKAILLSIWCISPFSPISMASFVPCFMTWSHQNTKKYKTLTMQVLITSFSHKTAKACVTLLQMWNLGMVFSKRSCDLVTSTLRFNFRILKGSLPHARPFDTPGTSFIGVHMRAYACHRRVMGLHMNIIGVHMHIIGVHMHIIGVHTRANKIRARRAKVRACGRPALGV